MKSLGPKAINLEPGFGAAPIAFDDRLLLPVYEAPQDWPTPVFLMTGPATPDLAFNDPSATVRVARQFPQLSIVVHHGAWPRVDEIVGVAFRCENVTLVPECAYSSAGLRASKYHSATSSGWLAVYSRTSISASARRRSASLLAARKGPLAPSTQHEPAPESRTRTARVNPLC